MELETDGNEEANPIKQIPLLIGNTTLVFHVSLQNGIKEGNNLNAWLTKERNFGKNSGLNKIKN